MANLNKVMLIGRLTRDPEVRTFSNGGKVAKFGFAVNNRTKKGGEWVDEPVFLDCQAFNRGEFGKLADRVEQMMSKGKQCYLEGHLVLEQWTSRAGEKRQALKIVVDSLQMLDGRGNSEDGGSREPRGSSRKGGASAGGDAYDFGAEDFAEEGGNRPAPREDEELPF